MSCRHPRTTLLLLGALGLAGPFATRPLNAQDAGSPSSGTQVARPEVHRRPSLTVRDGGGDDPFQRHVIFHNETPVTIWPVFQAPQDSNCTKELPGKLLRIHVNYLKKDAGIPPDKSVSVALPKDWPCEKGGFYDAVRIFLFTANAPKFEEKLAAALQKNQVTVPFKAGLSVPICASDVTSDPCWTGTADSAYALDSPAQLLEYTIISQDSKGIAFPNPNNPAGVPFLDFDVSYVDEAYLPAAMASDTGAIQYMGSRLSYADFRQRLGDFVTQAKWPQYAAFADLNFNATVPGNRTVFADLLVENGVGQYPRVPSGHQAVENSFNGGGTAFYKPSWDGSYPRECVHATANRECSVLLPTNTYCCPDSNGMQGCCDAKNYLVDKVTAKYNTETKKYRFSSEVLVDLTRRFTKWNEALDCTTNPPFSPVVDKAGFCNAFKRTLRFAWKAFTEQDAAGAKDCSALARSPELFDQCIAATVIGYRIDTTHAKDFATECKTCPDAPCPASCTTEKQLNESVQALLRGVPWTSKGSPSECGPSVCPSLDPAQCSPAKCVWTKTEQTAPDARLYHFDKFLHFWAPHDSVYNLTPYARVIHANDGLAAPGAYSFSIDDFYGNFGGPGTNLIVDIGGVSKLPNPEPYDPYKQYHVTVGEGWDHMSLCGRRVDIPKVSGMGIALGTPLSFYSPSGVEKRRQDPCEVVVFETADESRFVRYQLSEVSYDVTDTYTDKRHTVQGLSGVAASRTGRETLPDDEYCKAHSTPDLVQKQKCTGNLSAVGTGNRDAYSSVVDACSDLKDARCGKPLMNLAVPARIPF